MPSYIDLHTHTIASDGKYTPTELIRKAKQLGFSYIAKTDHDNVDLMDEFLAAGKKYKVHAIPGMEISSRFLGKALHITALGIDYHNKKILAYAQKCKDARRERGLKMVKLLARDGWNIKYNEVNRDVIVRPHVALAVINHPANKRRLLKEFGETPQFNNFIRAYIVPGKPAYVPKKYRIAPKAAIDMVHAAGGLAVIAHPSAKTQEFNYNKTHLNKIIKTFDFDGIEAYNHDATLEEIKHLLALTKKENLLVSAGSDYHGHDSSFPLGTCNGKKPVRANRCRELINKLFGR